MARYFGGDDSAGDGVVFYVPVYVIVLSDFLVGALIVVWQLMLLLK